MRRQLAGNLDDALEIGAGMSFVEERQNVIVDGFDGGRDKRTARIAQLRQTVRVLEQMLDLDRHVVRDARELLRKPRDDCRRVSDAVEEVRIAERDVPGAGSDLAADVSHDDIDGDDAEPAIVDGHDRTVAAPVFAAPAGLGIAGRTAFLASLQRGVLRQRRQPCAIGYQEMHARYAGPRGWRPEL